MSIYFFNREYAVLDSSIYLVQEIMGLKELGLFAFIIKKILVSGPIEAFSEYFERKTV